MSELSGSSLQAMLGWKRIILRFRYFGHSECCFVEIITSTMQPSIQYTISSIDLIQYQTISSMQAKSLRKKKCWLKNLHWKCHKYRDTDIKLIESRISIWMPMPIVSLCDSHNSLSIDGRRQCGRKAHANAHVSCGFARRLHISNDSRRDASFLCYSCNSSSSVMWCGAGWRAAGLWPRASNRNCKCRCIITSHMWMLTHMSPPQACRLSLFSMNVRTPKRSSLPATWKTTGNTETDRIYSCCARNRWFVSVARSERGSIAHPSRLLR